MPTCSQKSPSGGATNLKSFTVIVSPLALSYPIASADNDSKDAKKSVLSG